METEKKWCDWCTREILGITVSVVTTVEDIVLDDKVCLPCYMEMAQFTVARKHTYERQKLFLDLEERERKATEQLRKKGMKNPNGNL